MVRNSATLYDRFYFAFRVKTVLYVMNEYEIELL